MQNTKDLGQYMTVIKPDADKAIRSVAESECQLRREPLGV